jgi:hypothetical protein
MQRLELTLTASSHDDTASVDARALEKLRRDLETMLESTQDDFDAALALGIRPNFSSNRSPGLMSQILSKSTPGSPSHGGLHLTTFTVPVCLLTMPRVPGSQAPWRQLASVVAVTRPWQRSAFSSLRTRQMQRLL